MAVNQNTNQIFNDTNIKNQVRNILIDSFCHDADQGKALEQLAQMLFENQDLKKQAIYREMDKEFGDFFKELKGIDYNDFTDEGDTYSIYIEMSESNVLAKIDSIKKFQQYMCNKYDAGIDIRWAFWTCKEPEKNGQIEKPQLKKEIELDIEFNEDPMEKEAVPA